MFVRIQKGIFQRKLLVEKNGIAKRFQENDFTLSMVVIFKVHPLFHRYLKITKKKLYLL